MIYARDIPDVNFWLMNWDSICESTDRGAKRYGKNKYVKHYNKNTFAVIESSAPLYLFNSFWMVRVVYNKKTKIKYLDIRQYEIEHTRTKDELYPTTNGISLPLTDWIVLWKTTFKIIKKWVMIG